MLLQLDQGECNGNCEKSCGKETCREEVRCEEGRPGQEGSSEEDGGEEGPGEKGPGEEGRGKAPGGQEDGGEEGPVEEGCGEEVAGEKSRLAGRIALTEITGGTEGNPQIYEKISQAGVGTIIGMHMSEEHKKEAEKHHVNAIIAGHISSDSIGLNLLLDELEKRDVEVIPLGGLIRVRRYQKNARPSRKVRRRR